MKLLEFAEMCRSPIKVHDILSGKIIAYGYTADKPKGKRQYDYWKEVGKKEVAGIWASFDTSGFGFRETAIPMINCYAISPDEELKKVEQ